MPQIDGSALISLSGDAIERRAHILLNQSQERPFAGLFSKEKSVVDARLQMKASGNNSYYLEATASVNELRIDHETLSGQITSALSLDAKSNNLTFAVDSSLHQFPAKFLPMDMPLHAGPIKAAVQGHYSFTEKALMAQDIKLNSRIGTVEGEGTVSFKESPAALAMTLRTRRTVLESLKPLLPDPFRAFSYAGFLATDLRLAGTYNDPVITGSAWSDETKIEGKGFSLARLSLRLPFQWARSSLQVNAGQIQVTKLLFGQAGETRFKLGQASLSGSLVTDPLQPLRVSADFRVLEGGFSNADGTKIGENLRATGRFTARDLNGTPSFNGSARIERFELLWDKFFGDFEEQKPSIEFNGRYNAQKAELTVNQLQLTLAPIGQFEFKGSLQDFPATPKFNLEVRTDEMRHTSFFDFVIRDAFKIAHPILGQISVSGKSQLALYAHGSLEAFTLTGTLRLLHSEIWEKSAGWRVGPIDLDLPLLLHFPEAPKEQSSEPPSAGTLRIGAIQTSTTTIPDISTPVVLWHNTLHFPRPIRTSLFGGSTVLEGLRWKDIVNAPRDVSASIRLTNLQLLEVTSALGWYPFGGSLSGFIPNVHWTGDSLRCAGVIALNLFGGRATIEGMEIRNPLSPVQSIRMDARFDDLNLEQLSETFEFGRISGVLGGTIEGLVLSHNQPSQFKADIKTIDKAGVSQWISVEALNKITVLSSGNEAGGIYGGVAGFFDFFRYSKLGFKAALKNDKLVLHGIESKDGKEYLVVGTLLPPTVNIISHTQEIGFNELLRRLERIQQTGNAKSAPNP
jgi:hypothetical protein